jgi:hypothetical protein
MEFEELMLASLASTSLYSQVLLSLLLLPLLPLVLVLVGKRIIHFVHLSSQSRVNVFA